MYTPVRTRPPDLGDRPPELKGWRGIDPNVTLLGLTSMFTDLASEMVTSVIPLYLTFVFGFSLTQYGAFDGLYQGMAAITTLWAALVADRRRRHKEVAVVGYSMSAVSRLGLLMVHAWAPIVGLLYVDRLGKGIRTAPRDALISLSSTKARLAESFGVHRALDTVGAAAGPIVASLILSQNANGYQSVFVCSFFASCIGLGVLVLFVKNKRAEADADLLVPVATVPGAGPEVPLVPGAGLVPEAGLVPVAVGAPSHANLRSAVGLLRDRKFAAVLAVSVVLALVVPGDALIYLTYARDVDLAAGYFPLLFAGASIGFLLLAVPLGRLADRIGRARVFLAGEAMLFGVYALLGAGLGGLAPLLLLLLLYGGFYAATDGVIAAMASATLPSQLRTTGLAILGTAVAVAHLVSAITWGLVWDRWGTVVTTQLFMIGLVVALGTGVALLRPGDPPVTRWRIIAFALLCVVCVGGAIAYLVSADDPSEGRADVSSGTGTAPSEVASEQVAPLLAAPHVLFRDTDLGSGFGRVAIEPLDHLGQRSITDLSCERVDYAAGRGICLTADRGAVTTYGATIFDQDLNTVSTISLPGLPSRTRVSADGRHATMTTFVFGDSYAATTFSTRTQLLDLATGDSLGDLEQFTARNDGEEVTAVDRNFWGVTFGEGDLFYTTMATGGHRYLVKGDLSSRSVDVVTDDVECPSLSPDGTRIAFKNRSTGPLGQVEWRISVLDLDTLEVHPLAETASVDDQPEWLDDDTVLYGMPRGDTNSPSTDVWRVPADGSGSPELYLSGAWSPSVNPAGATSSTAP